MTKAKHVLTVLVLAVLLVGGMVFHVALPDGAVSKAERRKLDQLRMELGVEQSTVYRRRDKALFKFTEALFGPSAP